MGGVLPHVAVGQRIACMVLEHARMTLLVARCTKGTAFGAVKRSRAVGRVFLAHLHRAPGSLRPEKEKSQAVNIDTEIKLKISPPKKETTKSHIHEMKCEVLHVKGCSQLNGASDCLFPAAPTGVWPNWLRSPPVDGGRRTVPKPPWRFCRHADPLGAITIAPPRKGGLLWVQCN